MEKGPVAKSEVQAWWNKQACGTQFTCADKFSPQYFAEIEDTRYRLEPFIHSFAQFSRYRGKKVLEVGVGAGTDFIQWARSGAAIHGVDLTAEAVTHAQNRFQQEGLSAIDVRQADAESLPYPDGVFDLVYSWGVIHHSPDTTKALKEIVRVAKPAVK